MGQTNTRAHIPYIDADRIQYVLMQIPELVMHCGDQFQTAWVFSFTAAEPCEIRSLAQLILKGLYSLNTNTNFAASVAQAVQSLHSLLLSNFYLLPHKVWLQMVLRNITGKYQICQLTFIDCWGPQSYFGGKSVTNVMHATPRFRNFQWLLIVKRLKSRVSHVAAKFPSAWTSPFISYLPRAS